MSLPRKRIFLPAIHSHGIAASAFVDACACVASVASAAHELSSTDVHPANSAISFTSALLILCAVADFNIRSSSLLRAALAAAIACCCPRGRIVLASSAFPCDVWGNRGQPPANGGRHQASSTEDDDSASDAHAGGMGDVARAMQGQGFVVDVIELLADEGEDAAGRSAVAQSIGGDFVHQLMQVSFSFRCRQRV